MLDLNSLLATISIPQLTQASLRVLVVLVLWWLLTRLVRLGMSRLGERLVPSTLELSGCDAMFVLDDADVELAAKAAWLHRSPHPTWAEAWRRSERAESSCRLPR